MTFHDLADKYLTEHLLMRARSYKDYSRLWTQYFSGWSEDHPARSYIRAWHRSFVSTPSRANKGLGFLRAMYNWAINEELYDGENPATGIRRHPTYAREMVMTDYELGVLLAALPTQAWKFRTLLWVLLTTGCRLSEALAMEWAHVDFASGCWTKPHTKNGRPQRVPIPRQVCQMLQALPRQGQHVLTGAYQHSLSTAAAEKYWGQLRREHPALAQIRLHDFRRTLATRLHGQGEQDLLIKCVLNHTTAGNVTAVYVRPSFEKQADALQKHADALYAMVPVVEAVAV